MPDRRGSEPARYEDWRCVCRQFLQPWWFFCARCGRKIGGGT